MTSGVATYPLSIEGMEDERTSVRNDEPKKQNKEQEEIYKLAIPVFSRIEYRLDNLINSISDRISNETYVLQDEFLSLINKTKIIFQELLESFDNNYSRQVLFTKLKEDLKNMELKYIQQEDYLAEITTLLVDAVSYTKAEDLTKNKLVAIEKVIDISKKFHLELEDIRECGKILRKADIQTLPSL